MVTLTVTHQLLNFFCVLVISEKAVLAVLLAVMQLHPLTVQRLVLANERREKNFQFLQKLKSPRTNLYCNGQPLLQIHRLMEKYKHKKQGRCHVPVIASCK